MSFTLDDPLNECPRKSGGERFGARRGAHSEAKTDQPGALRAADGGTLFLDEVGELPLELQAKLLRAVERGEVLPLGATHPVAVDVAFVCATNADLDAAIAAGRFRRDLYERLAQVVVELPPLRERPEEVPWLVVAALEAKGALAALPGAPAGGVGRVEIVEECLRRTWEGTNVRGLVRAVNAARVNAEVEGRREVGGRDLPREGAVSIRPPGVGGAAAGVAAPVMAAPVGGQVSGPVANARDLKRQRMVEMYHRLGSVEKAAEAVGVGRSMGYELLREAGVRFR